MFGILIFLMEIFFIIEQIKNVLFARSIIYINQVFKNIDNCARIHVVYQYFSTEIQPWISYLVLYF